MRSICNILLVWILLNGIAVPCYSHGYDGHKKDLQDILFSDYYKLNFKGKQCFDLLCEATFITLDYTNQACGKDYLADLKNYGIKNLPLLEDISFSGNQYHQRYTHLGWDISDYEYKSKANWKDRKELLLATVEKICQFKDNERVKKDAFAALVYEIHILGDHIGDGEQTRYTRLRLVSEDSYYGQEVSPTSVGPFNNPTLFTYLLYHIQRLFRDQKNTYEYTQIISFLNNHKNEYYGQSPVSYDDIRFLAERTRTEMIKYIPKLLEREKFFRRAFID